jgi:hypothetical protein
MFSTSHSHSSGIVLASAKPANVIENRSTTSANLCGILVGDADLATKYEFPLQRNKGLPEKFIPFLRLCYCEKEEDLKKINLHQAGEVTEADAPILQYLVLFLQQRLARCACAERQLVIAGCMVLTFPLSKATTSNKGHRR